MNLHLLINPPPPFGMQSILAVLQILYAGDYWKGGKEGVLAKQSTTSPEMLCQDGGGGESQNTLGRLERHGAIVKEQMKQ
jgi:hypothetical protein